jgi:hypothetical protein
MSLAVKYLGSLQESGKLKPAVQEVIEIFLTALNDWPDPVINLEDYENAIYKLFANSEEITEHKLKEYLSLCMAQGSPLCLRLLGKGPPSFQIRTSGCWKFLIIMLKKVL